MPTIKKTIWFKAKKYGYGWYPSTWQGWAILIIYLLALFVSFKLLDHNYFLRVSIAIIITSILMYVFYKTGEPAHWRWGDKK